MNEQIKEELTEQFRAYLDTDFEPEQPADLIDQMALFSELAGLKNEVRIESRQLKGALDDFRQAFTSLDHAQQDVSGMMRHIQQQEKESAQAGLKPVIFGLIDLYDRIAAGLDQKPPRLTFLERLLTGRQRNRQWLQGHLEGQQMILGHLLGVLNQCGATVMESKGQRFDPTIMNAVGFEKDSQLADGVVLHENRKGFRLEGKTIRPAEVIVNKREE